MATNLLCSSKKGMSAHQLHRMLGVTYKTAWFMAHRIRYAMTQPLFVEKLKGIVEVDETYIGGKGKITRGRGSVKKMKVVSLVERNGNVRSEQVDRVTAKNLRAIINENVDKNAKVMTDDFQSYKRVKEDFVNHNVIKHSWKIYVDGFFSLLKRGINGIYHHVSKQHLNRYLKEFDFRYNLRNLNDGDRTNLAIKGF